MTAFPSWPFGRTALVPRPPRPAQRQQCNRCAGGGAVNGVWCATCEGRGWHDAQHPPHAEGG